MKKQIIKKIIPYRPTTVFCSNAEKRLYQASISSAESILKEFGNGPYGYNDDQVDEARASYGKNEVTHGKRNPCLDVCLVRLSIHSLWCCSFWLASRFLRIL